MLKSRSIALAAAAAVAVLTACTAGPQNGMIPPDSAIAKHGKFVGKCIPDAGECTINPPDPTPTPDVVAQIIAASRFATYPGPQDAASVDAAVAGSTYQPVDNGDGTMTEDTGEVVPMTPAQPAPPSTSGLSSVARCSEDFSSCSTAYDWDGSGTVSQVLAATDTPSAPSTIITTQSAHYFQNSGPYWARHADAVAGIDASFYLPCKAGWFNLEPPSRTARDTGDIYVGGWGGNGTGEAVDAGFQYSNNPGHDDYALFIKTETGAYIGDPNGAHKYYGTSQSKRFTCGQTLDILFYAKDSGHVYAEAYGFTIESPRARETVSDAGNVNPGRGWTSGNTNTVKTMVTIAQAINITPYCANGSFFGLYDDSHNLAAKPRPASWNPVKEIGAYILIKSGSSYYETTWAAYQKLDYYSGSWSWTPKWGVSPYPKGDPSYEELGVYCHA